MDRVIGPTHAQRDRLAEGPGRQEGGQLFMSRILDESRTPLSEGWLIIGN